MNKPPKANALNYQKKDLAYFPYQIEHAVNTYRPQTFEGHPVTNIVIAGLGGSGIAGQLVKKFFYEVAPMPLEVIGNYQLPAYAGSTTLLVLSSYSGNTEETITLAEEAKQRGCQTYVLTTNGHLEKLAGQQNWTVYYAEPGFQPRMALGYSLTYLLLLLGDLFNYPLEDTLRNVSNEFRDTEYFIGKAKEYFAGFEAYLNHKIIVVADSFTHPIGLRFCQQMQENAKTEAFLHEIPEANHNVIESYYGNVQSVFLFLDSGSNNRNTLRFQFLQDLLEEHGNPVVRMPMDDRQITHVLRTIFTLDWVALLMADAKQVDASEIPNIQTLKRVLDEAQQDFG